MLLRNGVTGFIGVSPLLKLKDIKRDCYSVINRIDGKIEDIVDQQYSRNFYTLVLCIREKYIHALFNSQYPFMAFATKIDPFSIIFTEEPQLTNAFKILSYQVLSVHDLNTPLFVRKIKNKIFLENNNDLNAIELKQIHYWQPKTIGDVLFNFWD